MLISIEGTDKVGKSTVTRILADKLETIAFRELPKKCEIRDWLNNSSNYIRNMGEDVFKIELTKKFMSHRENYQKLLDDLLKYYESVVVDRYVLSTLIYGKFENELMFDAHKNIIKLPDITVILTVSSEIIEERLLISGETDYYESLDKLLTIQNKFKDYYDDNKSDKNLLHINCDNKTPEQIVEKILEKCNTRI